MATINRPAVLLVTGFPFWALGDGQRMRVLALVWVLVQHVDLTILYLGQADQRDVQRLQALRVTGAFHALGAPGGPDDHRQAVRQLCASQHFDCCIVERLALDHVRDALPAGMRTVLDSHDLLTERNRSRALHGLPVDATTLDWELAAYARYDRVLMIQADEHARVARHLGERVMLVPHPVNFPQRPVRPEGRALGFVGAFNEPNADGLDWYADAVWPLLAAGNAQTHLFGWIGDAWRRGACPDFTRHGYVKDFNAVWGQIDVAINPVRWGSGLKIKSVEALGNGIPLVTTREGARGLTDLDGVALLIADEPAAFADACSRLLADPALRQRLGAAGHAFARQHLTPKACFGGLVDWLIT
jgi:glycosyltransferase involved in cell wall biosynthesis